MIKILIADRSAVIRSIEKEIITTNPYLQYTGSAISYKELIEKITILKPQGIILDSALFNSLNIESVFFELENSEAKIILFSNSKTENIPVPKNICIIPKPDFTSLSQHDLKQYGNIFEEIFENLSRTGTTKQSRQPAAETRIKNTGNYKAVFIGVSTGGPGTIKKLLTDLGTGFPLPILITQHIDSAFDKNLITWLNSNTGVPVHLAKSGIIPQKGHVYFAPANFHLVIKPGNKNDFIIELNDDAPVNFVRPSVDKMFFSAAEILGNKTIAVLLTGMGTDGAAGCCKIKNCGGYTIAEDEKSCVVYGMPKAAAEAGGAVAVLSLNEIADRLKTLAANTG